MQTSSSLYTASATTGILADGVKVGRLQHQGVENATETIVKTLTECRGINVAARILAAGEG